MIKKMIVQLAVIGVIGFSVTGCALPIGSQETSRATPTSAKPPGENDDMAKLIYLAAQTLIERSESLTKDHPIVVATIVSVDDLNRSCTFGRLASQLVANRIEQRGYLVRDVTYMGALALAPKTGELVLSREVTKVSTNINAQAVVAGTYAVAGTEIYLNLRLLRVDDKGKGELLSSVDVAIPRNGNTNPLLDTALTTTHAMVPYSQYDEQNN